MVKLKLGKFIAILGTTFLANSQPLVAAEIASDFRQVITHTVMTNPEVAAALYEFESVRAEQRAARGGYYPKLDLVAEVGREDSRTPVRDADQYTRDSTRLVLTQMLFDGFATRNEVDRLDHAKRVRYFELKSISEESALGAAQAYLDVLRQQKLVKLAEENYVEHQLIYEDIQKRADAGVSRGVDLEQASARTALASTNLVTETSNLFDVTARFQRIVGLLPASDLQAPNVQTDVIPETKQDVLHLAYATNPQLASAIENVLAAQAELRGKNAPMLPRFDLRLRQELDNDTDGITGSYRENAVELVMTYNLYNGGSDRARKKQFYQRLNSTQQMQEKACRDVRQTVSIAHNDIQALTQQVEYFNQNQISVGKARQTYRKQFEIGQRSLLDLLDTENEYFDVRRSYVNAVQDLQLAQIRTLAGMGILMESLNVNGLSNEALERLDDKDNHTNQHVCPHEVVQMQGIDKKALLAKTMQNYRFSERSDGKLAFRMDVKFANQSTEINRKFRKDILEASKFLNQHPKVTGVIEGHTDSSGSQKYNLDLSKSRAEAVRQTLIVDYGIAASRLTTKGYGESRPIDNNDSAAGRENNRRVELVLSSKPSGW